MPYEMSRETGYFLGRITHYQMSAMLKKKINCGNQIKLYLQSVVLDWCHLLGPTYRQLDSYQFCKLLELQVKISCFIESVNSNIHHRLYTTLSVIFIG